MNNQTFKHLSVRGESGFSYIDVMIAMTILLTGVLALAAAMTGAIVRVSESEEQLTAKQFAASTIEAIFSARDITALGWNAAQNEDNGGVFSDDREAILPFPGPDRVIGTGDDTGDPIVGYERQILIEDYRTEEESTDLPVSLRRITVTVFYRVGSAAREVSVSTTMGNFRQLS